MAQNIRVTAHQGFEVVVSRQRQVEDGGRWARRSTLSPGANALSCLVCIVVQTSLVTRSGQAVACVALCCSTNST